MRRQQKGFSLIELLIVVAIILIIAAIAIPNSLRSKMVADEGLGGRSSLPHHRSGLHSILRRLPGGYPGALTNLGPATPATSASADLIDSVLATGTKSGYTFAYAAGASGRQRQRSGLHDRRRTPPIAAPPVSAASSPTRPASSAPMPPPRLPRPAPPSARSAIPTGLMVARSVVGMIERGGRLRLFR